MEPRWTEVAQVVLVAAQLLVLIAAALVAWRQVAEAKRLREEQSRPFVILDFDVEQSLVFLDVRNVGSSMARDVRFSIEPPFETSLDHSLQELKMFRDGISTLPPRKVVRTLFDSAIQRKPRDLPDEYRVVVRYADQEGRRHFEEEFDLDLGIYWNLMRVTRYGVHDIHERLKEIRKEIGKWTATGGGVLRLSPQDLEEREERWRRQFED